MDLGSITLVSNPYMRQKDYWLNSQDNDKLRYVSDAVDGDTALEVDTGTLYGYFRGEWVPLGGGSND